MRECCTLLLLIGWVALCWAAVRKVLGSRLGPWEWLAVAWIAFGIPIMIADLLATRSWP